MSNSNNNRGTAAGGGLGILGIVENTKLSLFLAKILSPLIDWLWGKKDMNPEAKKYLSLSLSTSVLGIGGASVPFGIKAIEKMDIIMLLRVQNERHNA